MAGVVIVGFVRERTAQGPQMAALCQERQIFGDVDSRSARGNGAEFPANGIRGCGFRIERVELRRSARKKHEDDRSGSRRIARSRIASAQRPQRIEVLHTQAEQSHAAGLQQRASRDTGMQWLAS